MHIHTNTIQYKKRGFTLIEALVSLGIFSIVVVSATGVILSIISSNKKSQAISSVVNNLNYSVESMVRDIKTGYKYQCDIDAVSGTFGNPKLLQNYKQLPSSCLGASNNIKGVDSANIMLISTISGKEQIVKYELKDPNTPDAYIQKTLYTEDINSNVSFVSYPLTDSKNITVDKLVFHIATPYPQIPIPNSNFAEVRGQPSVFLILTGTAKVNQINISNFYIQTFISQRLPNFI